jgi:tRNA A37 methylthiotransferase MiaB
MINLATGTDTFADVYPITVKEQVLNVIRERKCNFLCFSIVDLFYNRSVDLMQYLKSHTNLPIIAGGIHAELYPEQTISVNGVDAICTGEAYKSFVNVLLNWDKRFDVDLPDFWFKDGNGNILKNSLSKLYDGNAFKSVPIPDYSYVNYYLLDGAVLKDISSTPDAGPFKVEQHQIGHEGSVIYSAMGGCSNHCSFCNLTAQVKIREEILKREGCTDQVRRYRHKPLSMVKRELEELVNYNKNMKFLCIMENDFTCRSEEELKKYCELISGICKIPCYTMVSPNTLNEQKLKYMIDNGFCEINMGIQTNQEFNDKYYDRQVSDERILEAVNMINSHRRKIKPFYDFINFNPEETDESIRKTVALVRKFPLPFDFVIHHLTLGEELLLYKRLIMEQRVPGEEVQKTNSSDYHNLKFDDYKNWRAFYLNLFLEWIAGPHNTEYAGRIPKNIKTLMGTPFGKILFKNEAIKRITINPDEDIFAFFTEKIFPVLNAPENREFLRKLNDALPPVTYTNQQ